jgi:hypothetical protein
MKQDIFTKEKEPIIFDELLPQEENLEILKFLTLQKWRIQTEANLHSIEDMTKCAFLNGSPHLGFACVAFDKLSPSLLFESNSPLIIWPRIISNIICKKLSIKLNINRIHWNYYLKGQEGVGHVDKESENFISILYNPLTTDGGTEINNKFYQDKMGQAKVFKSNWTHRGVATQNDKARPSLNIVLEY